MDHSRNLPLHSSHPNFKPFFLRTGPTRGGSWIIIFLGLGPRPPTPFHEVSRKPGITNQKIKNQKTKIQNCLRCCLVPQNRPHGEVIKPLIELLRVSGITIFLGLGPRAPIPFHEVSGSRESQINKKKKKKSKLKIEQVWTQRHWHLAALLCPLLL